MLFKILSLDKLYIVIKSQKYVFCLNYLKSMSIQGSGLHMFLAWACTDANN